METIVKRFLSAILLTVILSPAGFGQHIQSTEDGWPQWRGPCRDGISSETGLLSSWPEEGPELLWKTDGIGSGFSSPIISDDTIYITGDTKEELKIYALTLDGKLKWEAANGEPWKRSFPGSRSSCTISDGLLYHMNAHGRVLCLDAATGTERWSVGIMERYDSENIIWGFCESLLVDGDALIVTTASTKALMIALDKKTGKQIWATDPIDEEKPSYSSPILIEHEGRRQIVMCTSKYTFGIDAGSGKLLWKCPHAIEGSSVATTPSYHAGRVFVPGTCRTESKSYCVKLDGDTASVDWTVASGDPTGSCIFTDGLVVAASGHRPRGWKCLDPATGEITATNDDLAYGAALKVDGLYYGLTQQGRMLLMDINTQGIKIVSSFEFVKAKDAWAHPVILDGRLYLRYQDELFCYDISKK